MNLSKSYEFFKPEMLTERIHVIGCGSVGSTLCENLVRFGITKFTLYDFDRVEAKNIVNQMFTTEDIGKMKTEAVAEMMRKINPEVDIKLVNEGWNANRMSGYVFLCVDNIETRKLIAESNKSNTFIKGMFDFRTRLTDAQHYAADWSDTRNVDSFIESMNFTHEEAEEETPMSACHVTLSVCPTIRMIVAAGVSNFINFVKGEKLKKLMLIDAFNFEIEAY